MFTYTRWPVYFSNEETNCLLRPSRTFCLQKPAHVIYHLVYKSQPFTIYHFVSKTQPIIIYVLFPETHHHPVYCFQKPIQFIHPIPFNILFPKAHINSLKRCPCEKMFTKDRAFINNLLSEAPSLIYVYESLPTGLLFTKAASFILVTKAYLVYKNLHNSL